MAIEIVDLPINSMVIFHGFLYVYHGRWHGLNITRSIGMIPDMSTSCHFFGWPWRWWWWCWWWCWLWSSMLEGETQTMAWFRENWQKITMVSMGRRQGKTMVSGEDVPWLSHIFPNIPPEKLAKPSRIRCGVQQRCLNGRSKHCPRRSQAGGGILLVMIMIMIYNNNDNGNNLILSHYYLMIGMTVIIML